jgi:F420-0:gamma-glutamyl ligase-like protein
MQTVLVISVNENRIVDIKYDDPIGAWIEVLWWIELAKTLVLEKLLNTQVTKTWNQNQKPQEESVSKEEMIWLLLKTRKKIEQRISIVNQSDENQSFTINKSLFYEI